MQCLTGTASTQPDYSPNTSPSRSNQPATVVPESIQNHKWGPIHSTIIENQDVENPESCTLSTDVLDLKVDLNLIFEMEEYEHGEYNQDQYNEEDEDEEDEDEEEDEEDLNEYLDAFEKQADYIMSRVAPKVDKRKRVREKQQQAAFQKKSAKEQFQIIKRKSIEVEPRSQQVNTSSAELSQELQLLQSKLNIQIYVNALSNVQSLSIENKKRGKSVLTISGGLQIEVIEINESKHTALLTANFKKEVVLSSEENDNNENIAEETEQHKLLLCPDPQERKQIRKHVALYMSPIDRNEKVKTIAQALQSFLPKEIKKAKRSNYKSPKKDSSIYLMRLDKTTEKARQNSAINMHCTNLDIEADKFAVFCSSQQFNTSFHLSPRLSLSSSFNNWNILFNEDVNVHSL